MTFLFGVRYLIALAGCQDIDCVLNIDSERQRDLRVPAHKDPFDQELASQA